MTLGTWIMRDRFKLAGILVSVGLLVQAATLYWAHPLTFVAFMVLGGFLVVAGIALYLLFIASR